MTKIFIDTNIFLNLYGSNFNSLTIFDNDIVKLRKYLIITDQIFDEFIRNRDTKLTELINNFSNNNIKLHTSAIVKDLECFPELEEIKIKFEEFKEKILDGLKEMKEDEEMDPVYTSFLNLYNNSEVIRLNRNDEIIKNAHCRKLLGNPPTGNKQNTIGDEVNWETILSNLDDDLIIITRDETFEKHITFLKIEYKTKIHKKLYIYKNISDGLKKIGESPSEELDKFEKEQQRKENTSLYTSLLSSVPINTSIFSSLSSVPINTYILSSLSHEPINTSIFSSLSHEPININKRVLKKKDDTD